MAGRTTTETAATAAPSTAETAGKGRIAMARKTTTAADIAAAIALGVMPEDAPIITTEEAARQAEEAARQAVADALAVETARQARRTAESTTTTTTAETAEHHCTQRGCRHGSHSGPTQPDRQYKLTAPCGAVLRMTARALARAGGTVTCGHGDAFAIDPTRRKYGTPKTTAETAATA